MGEKIRVSIVCGHGVIDPRTDKCLTEFYPDEFIHKSAVEPMKELINGEIDYLIYSGGYTKPNIGLSEAESYYLYALRRLEREGINVNDELKNRILLEKNALDSPQNFVEGRNLFYQKMTEKGLAFDYVEWVIKSWESKKEMFEIVRDFLKLDSTHEGFSFEPTITLQDIKDKMGEKGLEDEMARIGGWLEKSKNHPEDPIGQEWYREVRTMRWDLGGRLSSLKEIG